MRYIVFAFAVLSVFFFPFPLTVLLSFVASLYVPVAGLFIGAFADLLYYTPHASAYPIALVLGAVVSLVAFIVRRFVRARVAL